MKRYPISFGLAVFLVISGLVVGSIFTFGMQYWDAEVTREECILVETRFASYEEIRSGRRNSIQEIAINCVDGNRHYVDGVSINPDLINSISKLSPMQEITLLIHPNDDAIVEFSTEEGNIIEFDDTMRKLGVEATAFLIMGLFMYLMACIGLYSIVRHIVQKKA